MIDPFAVLDQPRRPWLDQEQLKQKHHDFARSEHPDLERPADTSSGGGTNPPSTLAAVNEAYRILSSPRLRLQYLLTLEDASGDVRHRTDSPWRESKIDAAGEMADLFMEAATLVQDVDAVIAKRNNATSALGKSLLQTETGSLGDRARRLFDKLNDRYQVAEEDLRRADEMWTSDRAKIVPELRRLIEHFAYLDRWIEQLREKQFQLAS